jgi:replicative DNA helicase
MFLYRDEYYDPDTDRPGTADVLIKKNRSGEARDVELRWHGATQQFSPDPNWKKKNDY